jgi:hypothetical protein
MCQMSDHMERTCVLVVFKKSHSVDMLALVTPLCRFFRFHYLSHNSPISRFYLFFSAFTMIV